MGNFKQHVTCSTVTGIVVGGVAFQMGLSVPTCLLSAGLCSIAGMLPDIDSDSSRSFQECIHFAAGLTAVLLIDHLKQFHIDRDIIILSGAAAFLFVRFGVGTLIKKYTAHRGMFHSIPAAILSGEIVFFLAAGNLDERIFKALAIFAGYMSHLILDEICSIDRSGPTLRLKKSFGTALKLFDSKRIRIALALYAVVFGLGFLAVNYPEVITSPSPDENFASNFSTEFREKWEDLQTRLKRGTCDMSAAMEEGAKLLVNEVASRNATGLGGADIPMENALVNGPAGRNLVPLSSTEASSAAPSAPPPADRRYSELRMFSRMRNGTQGTESPSLQTDTTSVPIGSIGQNDPANMVPNLGVPNQGPVVMGAVPVPPVQWTASSVSVPPIAVSASVSAPYGLSSNDFAPPPSNQYIPVAPDLAPAPLMLP